MRTATKTLTALTMSLALIGSTAVVLTFAMTDAAYAKSDKGASKGKSSGGGKGNGKGKSSEKKGGKSSSAKSGTKASGKGVGSAKSASGDRSGSGKFKPLGFLERLPKHQRSSGATKAKSAPVAIKTPAKPASNGKNWKTRLDGEVSVHPSELGPWNSAKRSQRAIDNMVAKYLDGQASGAGGLIGRLAGSYQLRNDSQDAFQSTLQAAVDNGDLPPVSAQKLLEGNLSAENLGTEIDALNGENAGSDPVIAAVYSIDDTTNTVSCEGPDCDDAVVMGFQDDADAIAYFDGLAEDDPLRLAAEGFQDAAVEVAAAEDTVVPQKTPELADDMLAYVTDLLDIELTEPAAIVPPPTQPVEPEPIEAEGVE